MTAPNPALDLISAALKAHQGGDLAAAERLYDSVLALEPRNWLALTNRAVVWMQTGRLEQGIEGVRESLAITPSQPEGLTNLGQACRSLGRTGEAIAAFRQAVDLAPRHRPAWIRLAETLQELGRAREAADAYGRAADSMTPGDPDLWRLRQVQGLLLYHDGHKAEALEPLRRAAAENPASPELFNDLGIVLHDNDLAEEAVAAFDRAIRLRPDDAQAFSNQARALHHLDRIPEALERLDRAVALQPGDRIAWRHRGDALAALGRFEEALASHDRALELTPQDPDSWVRRADVLGFLRRMEEAMAAYDRALTLDPDDIKAPFNLACTLLREGAYADGWRLYEHRWRDKSEAMPALPAPVWLGDEPVEGKTILLHSEQGLGDTIMMMRYAPLLARRGARVLFSVPEALVRLAESVEGVQAVIPQGRPLPPLDLHIPVMSLPFAFRTEYDTIPGEPYGKAQPEDIARWTERLGPRRRPRIGLAWSGNPKHNEDRWRSIPLDALRPLAGLDADLYAVQLDIPARDRAAAEAMGLRPLGAALGDFADTAGLVETLDLVISVDTALAHLTGALGRPGLLLLAAVPDYRWTWEGEDSPWHPSLTLIRQDRIGDWSGVAAAATQTAAARLGLPPP